MNKFVNAEDVKDLLNGLDSLPWEDEVEYMVDSLIAADVAEVKHGEWILERELNGNPYCFHCSICDDDFHYIGIKVAYDYCPNCGAKMDGE